jgi:hypothetical protein
LLLLELILILIKLVFFRGIGYVRMDFFVRLAEKFL